MDITRIIHHVIVGVVITYKFGVCIKTFPHGHYYSWYLFICSWCIFISYWLLCIIEEMSKSCQRSEKYTTFISTQIIIPGSWMKLSQFTQVFTTYHWYHRCKPKSASSIVKECGAWASPIKQFYLHASSWYLNWIAIWRKTIEWTQLTMI